MAQKSSAVVSVREPDVMVPVVCGRVRVRVTEPGVMLLVPVGEREERT